MSLGIVSKGIAKIPFLSELLGEDVHFISKAKHCSAIAGWGLKPSTRAARLYAKKHQLAYVALEDGFLRSFGTGDTCPPLAVVRDELGIYYDCTKPSSLELLLSSDAVWVEENETARTLVRAQLLNKKLSKYNHAPLLKQGVLRDGDIARVLVVDQTRGDMSVALGGAYEQSFQAMLQAALTENPEATIYVKTHPEVSSGRKVGYLTDQQTDLARRIVVLRDAVNPLSLIEQMDKVYVVTSTMGFEALLAGKTVSCFGVPWYAGWGVTDDRQPEHPAILRRAKGRRKSRSVDELFVAAYVKYTRYLNPETRQLGNVLDVINWLERQRDISQRFSGRMIVVDFRRWKASNVQSMLSLRPGAVVFAKSVKAAGALNPIETDCLIFWGCVAPSGLESLANQCGCRLLRMEDGFVRSVGLGSDLIPPQSFVLDSKGIYFDPSQPSELEDLLNSREFTADDLQRASNVRETIVANGITKYNLEPVQKVRWGEQAQGRKIALVPGQVEDDASISFGCDCEHGVHTNLGLLEAVRESYPEAFIVYKPHPDVSSGNRKGRLERAAAMRFADHIELQASVVSCIEACDVVAVMTSLTGFDALLRGKAVDVYGRPFYAGWGLTNDRLSVPRRERALSLDELVAGALLHYPLYWDPILKGYTTCEAVLHRVVEERDALAQSGKPQRLNIGYIGRQIRKLKVLARSMRLKKVR